MSASRKFATILTVQTLLSQLQLSKTKLSRATVYNYLHFVGYGKQQSQQQFEQRRLFGHSTVGEGARLGNSNCSTLPAATIRHYNLRQYQQSRQQSNHSTAGKKIVPFILSDIGEGIKEVIIKDWLKKVGDSVSEFDEICEVESDKATATITSRFEGIIAKIHYEIGDTARVGQPLVDIELSGSTSADAADESFEASPGKSSSSSKVERKSSQTQVSLANSHPIATLPSIRRMAHEKGVDLSKVPSSGKGGRILREDLDRYLGQQQQRRDEDASSTNMTSSHLQQTTMTTSGAANQAGEVELKVPLRTIQRVMLKTMTQSLKIPHFNYADEIDLTALTEATNKYYQTNGVKVANFAFIIKMVSMALREYPELNASLDESQENLLIKPYHNIGIAMDTKQGLIVPVIKNVQKLSVEQVNSELLRLRELGYASKLGPSEFTGGTISLSNIGAIGGIFGVPVIVSPEIVIGALGKTRVLPRFNSQGGIEARKVMQIVWSADHRVVDGATMSRFSNLLKQFLEDPHTALLKAT